MRHALLFIACSLAACCLGAGTARAQEPDLGTEAQRADGLRHYGRYCAQCHGDDGDGRGVAAPFFHPRPRDFTAGLFKFRTTRSGELPTDADLRRSIREGMPTTGMPAWATLSEQEVQQLVYALKTFNDDFAGAYGVVEPIEIPDAPRFSEASAERGRQVYVENECFKCHGDAGRGDGPSAPTLRDDWGFAIRPADLTRRWAFRNGSTRRDIYRTFTTGLDGTPMPAFEVPPEDRWALVDYVYSLSRDEPGYGTVVVSHPVDGGLDLRRGAALFADAEPAYFPVVGQVLEPGRAFQPGVTDLEVRAVHDADEIALLLVWHDMTPDTAGTNGPALAVPRMDAAEADTAAGPFSDAVAVQLPWAPPEGAEKPYFVFGDADHPVDLWFADLSGGAAARFVGRGSARVEPADTAAAGGVPSFFARYEDGAWTAAFKRSRTAATGVAFDEGTFVPVAFSVWEGLSGERGNRRGLTSWYHVYVPPLEQRSAALPMVAYGLLTLLAELGLVFYVRRRHKKRPVTA